jgi:8-oxo-dGTP pyrophosphatase MutT (NUDIX family)
VETKLPQVRHSARVLLLDELHRVFLFRGTGPGEELSFWFPPGGGLEPGETHEQAAMRELGEEVGLTDVLLGPCVWRRSVVFRWGEDSIDSREHWYVCRLEAVQVDLSAHVNPDEAERELTLGYGWWSLDEIVAAKDEVFVPRQLGRLLEPLLRGEYPPAPIEIGP